MSFSVDRQAHLIPSDPFCQELRQKYFENVNINVNILLSWIKLYKTQSGKIPVRDFLDSLSSKDAQKVIWVLELIETLEVIPVRYFKKLSNTDDLWEVRARIGSNSFRLLGFLDDEFIVLTNGFAKKSQKTTKQEIDLAEQRKADYQLRKGDYK